MRAFAFLILFISAAASGSIFPECVAWFKESGIDAKSKNCESDCSMQMTDMATFMCPMQCKELCQSRCGRVDSFWLNKLKPGRPPNWPHKDQITKPWSNEEKSDVLRALKRYPEKLWTDSIQGVYRMKASKEDNGLVPGTSARNYIVLYDTAFGRLQGISLDEVLAHELSHQKYWSLSQKQQTNYAKLASWNTMEDAITPVLRRDVVLRNSSRQSIDEDFAVNMENFLFAPHDVKSKLSALATWLTDVYGSNFRIDSGCENAKK